jgi:hypothetical protein
MLEQALLKDPLSAPAVPWTSHMTALAEHVIYITRDGDRAL